MRPLPPIATEIKESIGYDGLVALVQARGGQRLRIPSTPKPHHPLAELLGSDLWERLRADFSGSEIDVPLLWLNRTGLLHAAVRSDRARLTLNEIAAKHRIGIRQVKRILAAARCAEAEQRQGQLAL